MYYLIRIIFIIIIFAACFLFLLKKKPVFLNQMIRNRKKRIIGIVLLWVIIGLGFVPYEAPFIRFDSPEASVKYSKINGNLPLHVIEGENTVFTLQNAHNNYYYHTIIKHDDKYGFCDYHSKLEQVLYTSSIEDDNFSGIITAEKLSSNETGEACYMISFLRARRLEQNKIAVFAADNTPIKPIFQKDGIIVFAFVQGVNKSDAAFSYNGQTFRLN